MNIELQEWHARYILEALRVLEQQWSETARASNDEDLQADIGDDMIRLSGVHDYLERNAVEAFGNRVSEFSRDLLVPTSPLSENLHTL